MLNTGCSSVVFKKVLDQKLISVSMILTITDHDVTAPVYRCDQRSLSTLHLSSVSVFWWSHDKSVQHTDTWNVANCLFTLNDICWQNFLSTTCQSKQPVVVCLVHARQTGVSDLLMLPAIGRPSKSDGQQFGQRLSTNVAVFLVSSEQTINAAYALLYLASINNVFTNIFTLLETLLSGHVLSVYWWPLNRDCIIQASGCWIIHSPYNSTTGWFMSV